LIAGYPTNTKPHKTMSKIKTKQKKKRTGLSVAQRRKLKQAMIEKWGLNKDWAKDHLIVL
jgi:hypothetical protein